MRTELSKFLEQCRVRHGPLASDSSLGPTGAFQIPHDGKTLGVISSTGDGWDHVSVSIVNSTMPPSWDDMRYVAQLFFAPDEWAMQLHPPASQNINCHPGCLHIWRPNDGRKIPLPPPEMV